MGEEATHHEAVPAGSISRRWTGLRLFAQGGHSSARKDGGILSMGSRPVEDLGKEMSLQDSHRP